MHRGPGGSVMDRRMIADSSIVSSLKSADRLPTQDGGSDLPQSRRLLEAEGWAAPASRYLPLPRQLKHKDNITGLTVWSACGCVSGTLKNTSWLFGAATVAPSTLYNVGIVVYLADRLLKLSPAGGQRRLPRSRCARLRYATSRKGLIKRFEPMPKACWVSEFSDQGSHMNRWPSVSRCSRDALGRLSRVWGLLAHQPPRQDLRLDHVGLPSAQCHRMLFGCQEPRGGRHGCGSHCPALRPYVGGQRERKLQQGLGQQARQHESTYNTTHGPSMARGAEPSQVIEVRA